MAGYSGGIPETIIEEIISRNDIAAVVGQYVRFTKTSGQNLFGLCPFHSEDTPSFSVSATKQIYYCFGCHKGGNVVHFIMEIEKCGYLDALKLLADRASIKLPEPQDENYQREARLRDEVRQALVEAARFYYRNLVSPEGKKVWDYLQKRQISPATAKTFGLGYAPEGWDGLYQHLKKKNYSQGVLEGSGLFTKNKRGELIDLFRGRLMFPIFDVLGKVIAFGGRIMGEGQPKYINSPESLVYSKQRNLYALNFAKSAKGKQLIIVEGYMDVISMHQAGFTNTVASLGTALTERQLDLLTRFTEDVVLFYDSDRAGQAAALRGLQMLLQRQRRHTAASTRISVARVPDGKDPDEYLREHGAAAFQKVVNQAASVLEYLMQVAKEKSLEDGKFDSRKYLQLACTYLSWEPNAVLREQAAGQAANLLGVSVRSVLEETSRIESQDKEQDKITEHRQQIRQEESIPKPDNSETISQEELTLLCLLVTLGQTWDQLPDKPVSEDFTGGAMQEIAKEALILAEKGQLEGALLLSLGEGKFINNRSAREVLTESLMRLKTNRDVKEQHQRILTLLYRRRIQRYTQAKNDLALYLDSGHSGEELALAKAKFVKLNQYLSFLKQKLKEYQG